MQQKRAPRPLPLFLELVRAVSEREPELAAKALAGLAKYERAPRRETRAGRAAIARAGPASLRDCGGSGAPAVLVPSLINSPDVLDLDEESSLASAVAGMGRHALLLDWGRSSERADLDLGGHIEQLLLPLLGELDSPPSLIGYCLGGTMAIAASNLVPVERVATLAAPWRFSGYPRESRDSLLRLWESAKGPAERLNALPIEVLQSAFWSLDPTRTVAKFASFADFSPDSAGARRFVTLEDWANEGESLPFPAARELIEDLFGSDLPGIGQWEVGGRAMTHRLDCPVLHVTASGDRITPTPAAPAGETVRIDSGHVGMVVGSARTRLHESLAKFLAAPCR
ncbi:MAG TPA: alpha/beta hydrolase [Sphingomicrobium sp.]|nr:alpha/beta hydrolase [Sphingomicrobium sp.]